MIEKINPEDIGLTDSEFVSLEKETLQKARLKWVKVALLFFILLALFFYDISIDFKGPNLFWIQLFIGGFTMIFCSFLAFLPPRLEKNNPEYWIKTIKKRKLPVVKKNKENKSVSDFLTENLAEQSKFQMAKERTILMIEKIIKKRAMEEIEEI